MSFFVSRFYKAVLPAVAVVGAIAFSASSVSAQRAKEPASRVIQGTDGSAAYRIPDKRGFNLFGSGDFAVTGMRGVGQLGWALTNMGPCGADAYVATGDCGHVLKDGVWRSKLYEYTIIMGTPRHEFRKIRTINPAAGAANLGGGFNYTWNNPLLQARAEVGPADNTLGVLFSGEVTTNDNSCRDHRAAINGYVVAGFTMLPGSNCPITWGPNGFQGPKVIPDAAFLALAAEQGNDFQFDFWQIPESAKSPNFQGNFSTYGLMSDYHDEILDSYGANVPGRTKAPSIPGYPLGIEMRFDAWTSSLPSIANTVFYQLTVVNNSEKVYGQKIDYDSLYMGLEVGFYDPNQFAQTYYVPHRNALMSNNRGTHPACNGTRVIPGTPGCASVNGFNRGAVGIVVLKSPIGDTRNKLLSRPGPFQNLSNPNKSDTITFNHGHKCGYGGCLLGNIEGNERRLFGLLSSTGENALDGRSVNDLLPTDYYYLFRSHDWPNRSGKFNAHVVPGWDYNGGGDDTLFYDTCDESITNTRFASQGADPKCVSTWSDSMPGGFVNSYGNVGGVLGVGPFVLKGGDTTSFFYAFVGAADSTGIEAATTNATEAYLNFFAGPGAPPNPTVVSSNIGTQTTGVNAGRPYLEIVFSDAPEAWVDPFLMKYAADLEASTDPTQVALRTNNPTLIADIRARAAQNFAELLIYKSCDGGATFTSDADCDPDPLVDISGANIGNGYRPYLTVKFDPTKGLPNVFRDNDVVAGRTYLYSFVTRSVGFSTVVKESSTGPGKVLVVAEPLLSPVATSGPTTLTIRIPASRPNKGVTATSTLTRSGTPSTLDVNLVLQTNARPGTYRFVFGNRFLVRTATSNTSKQSNSQVHVQDFAANARRNNLPVDGGVVMKEEIFNGPGVVNVGGLTETGTAITTTVGDSTVVVRQYNGLAFLLTSNTQPLFISASPTSAETVPGNFYGNPNFPGFNINIDTSKVGKYVAGSERAIRANSDTVNAGVLNAFGLQFDEGAASSTPRNGAAGKYSFLFQDDPYGPTAPFRLSLPNVALSQAEVTSSLNARTVTTTGVTTAEAKAAILAAVGPTTTLGTQINAGQLIAAKFPFSVTNETFSRPVQLAMVRRTDIGRTNTILLGTGNDTLRVAVPEDTWVPGDQFYMLETVLVDSTVAGALVFGNDPVTGQPDNTKPIRNSRLVATFVPTTLGCASPRPSCNPLEARTVGSGGYLTYEPGTRLEVTYEVGFNRESELTLTIAPVQVVSDFNAAQRSAIRVVPNPYVVQSGYDVVTNRVGESRVIFTNVPATGTLRIYSVSGQYLQAISWTEADLQGSRDLPYNLRTREGLDLASGLYIYVITANDARGKSQLARGKFVVIR